MNRQTLLLAILLVATPASAQDGALFIAWNNCFHESGSDTTLTFYCEDYAPQQCFISFQCVFRPIVNARFGAS